MLDIVDKLRSGGVSRYIDLPQIIVCGDQSSGKSSVLEAISGMAFPAKDNLCTRFATEVILRRSPSSTVNFSIVPAADRPQAEKESLRGFASTGSLDTLDLGSVVDKAKALMGVGDQKAFSSDILRVELSGPRQPHLTLVDLPGIFRAGNLEQAAEDANLVRNLVLSYMKRQRTIILAVVSAKNDFALQEVTQLARQLDPKGMRTLGLITKPDTLDEGSDSETAYVKLAKNEDVHFRLGWHVLRNRDFVTKGFTLDQRHQAEKEFFSRGVWTSINQSHLGVGNLKTRLTSVLHNQVLSQLPNVVSDLEKKIDECREQLRKIGASRATTVEQRQYLVQASYEYSKLMKAAIDGNYTDPFLAVEKEEGYKRRVRAVIQNSLIELESVMLSEGHAKRIVSEVSGQDDKEISRNAFLAEVKVLISQNRGCEIPGTFNPAVIGPLFRNQSRPWRKLLKERLNLVLLRAYDAVEAILRHLLDGNVRECVLRWIVNASLQDLGKAMEAKLDEIMTGHERLHPITYNSGLRGIVRNLQRTREVERINRLLDDYDCAGKISRAIISPLLVQKVEDDLDRDASSDAVDWMEAYYDVRPASTQTVSEPCMPLRTNNVFRSL